MSGRPKYIFCWWCSRQLRSKQLHTKMRPTAGASESADVVIVHVTCAKDMEREGGWEVVSEQADTGAAKSSE